MVIQLPSIQQVSQHLIACLVAIFQDNNNIKLCLRDFTQAYVQSTSNLNRKFYIWPPPELILLFGASFDYIVKIMKLLYGIPKAGNHWFAIYHTHHKEKLRMEKSLYNLGFFYKFNSFGIVEI